LRLADLTEQKGIGPAGIRLVTGIGI
jgi:hypothetical protein